MANPKEQKADFRHIVRIANNDLDGRKQILYAMRKIKGVNVMFANLVLSAANVNKKKKVGELSPEDVRKLDTILLNLQTINIPSWMLNRRKDYETGEDKHLLSADLTFTVQNDIKRLKKIKTYRGIRHMQDQPTRGQRTKSNFRKNKGKTSLGVQKKKIAPQKENK